MRVLKFIKEHLISSIFISVLLGLFIGNSYDVTWLKNLIIPLTFVLVYPMMVTLNLHSIFSKSDVKLHIVTQLINFIVFPGITFLLGYLFFSDQPYLFLGLIMISLFPTSGMTISWTVMAKGNVNEAIKMVVIGLLLGGLLSPFYLNFLLGKEVYIEFISVFKQILIVVFIPLILAYITQRALIKSFGQVTFDTKIKKVFPLFSTLGVVLIIFVAISLKAKVLFSNPGIILDILIPLLIMYVSFFTISFLIGKLLFKREERISLMNGTLIRNLSLALAITINAFPDAGIAALVIAIAYFLQVQFAAFGTKNSNRIYR